jgi:hypothetical protein
MAMLLVLAMQGILILALFWIQCRSCAAAKKKTNPPHHHD